MDYVRVRNYCIFYFMLYLPLWAMGLFWLVTDGSLRDKWGIWAVFFMILVGIVFLAIITSSLEEIETIQVGALSAVQLEELDQLAMGLKMSDKLCMKNDMTETMEIGYYYRNLISDWLRERIQIKKTPEQVVVTCPKMYYNDVCRIVLPSLE